MRTAVVDREVPRELWGVEDTLRLIGFLAAGLALTVAGTFRASGEARLADQTSDINLAVVGVLVAFFGGVRWFLTGRYAVGVRRARLVEARLALLDDAAPLELDAPVSAVRSSRLVAGPSLGLYHRSDCVLAAGKGFQPMARSEHLAQGRTPCRVCAP